MPIVPAKCPNCAANLSVDSVKEAAVCQYCETPFVVEKAINNYNTTNNISAGIVNVYQEKKVDFSVRAGTLIEYNGVSDEAVIPDGVTIIGRNAFRDCIGLKKVIIPESVVEIQSGAFYCCSRLETANIPSGVRKIGREAFYGCISLEKISIPNGVSEIKEKTFWGCELQEITIPDSVLKLEKDILATIGEKNIEMYPFEDSEKLVINASEEWKAEHWECHRSLEKYKPKPKVEEKQAENNPDETAEEKDFFRETFGCYIATAVYGSYDCPQVWTLRRYRDNVLQKSSFGRAFVKAYYKLSPSFVKRFGKMKWFSCFFRKKLDKIVLRLNEKGFEDTPYEDGKNV